MSMDKNIYDLVGQMISNESPEAQQLNVLRAAALSPVAGGGLERAISAYEKSADSTELAQARSEAPMKPAHAEFIMEVRKEAVLDAAHISKKLANRPA